MQRLRYTGIWAFGISLTTIFLLALNFDYSKYVDGFVLSDFGRDPVTANVFNILMMVSGVLSILFVIYLKSALKLPFTTVFLLFVATIGLLGVGLFPLPTPVVGLGRSVHWIAALCLFLGFPGGVVMVGVELAVRKLKFGSVSVILGAIHIFVGAAIWLASRNVLAVEIWGIGMSAFWVLITTFQIPVMREN
jgi:hypothetical membrane protein